MRLPQMYLIFVSDEDISFLSSCILRRTGGSRRHVENAIFLQTRQEIVYWFGKFMALFRKSKSVEYQCYCCYGYFVAICYFLHNLRRVQRGLTDYMFVFHLAQLHCGYKLQNIYVIRAYGEKMFRFFAFYIFGITSGISTILFLYFPILYLILYLYFIKKPFLWIQRKKDGPIQQLVHNLWAFIQLYIQVYSKCLKAGSLVVVSCVRHDRLLKRDLLVMIFVGVRFEINVVIRYAKFHR